MTFFTVLVYIVCTRATITKWNYWLYEAPPTGHVLKSILNQIYFSKWISVLIWQPWLLYTPPSVVGCVVRAAEQRSLDLLLLHAAVNEGGGKTICETERKNFRFVSFYFKLSLVSPVFFSPASCARPPLLQTNTHVCVLYTKKQKNPLLLLWLN